MSLDRQHTTGTPVAPVHARRKSKVSARVKADVLARIHWHCRDKDHCWPGNARLCEDTGHCERSVKYALRELEAEGVIRVEQGRRRMIYLLRPASGGASGAVAGGWDAPPVAPRMHPYCFEPEEKKERKNNTPPQGGVYVPISDIMRRRGMPIPAFLVLDDVPNPRMTSWTPKPAPSPSPPPKAAQPAHEDPQVAKLTARGVPPGKARDLVRRFPPERIEANLRYSQGEGVGYIIDAINEDYDARAKAKTSKAPPGPARATESMEEAIAQAKAKKAQKDVQDAQDQAVKDHWDAMTPTERKSLDDRLMEEHPDLRHASPRTRQMALVPMRQEAIRALLGFPGGPS